MGAVSVTWFNRFGSNLFCAGLMLGFPSSILLKMPSDFGTNVISDPRLRLWSSLRLGLGSIEVTNTLELKARSHQQLLG